jgi:hypothetical protein
MQLQTKEKESITTEINCHFVSPAECRRKKYEPGWQDKSKDRSSSCVCVAVLESACSPSFVPEFPARLSEFSSPFAEDGLLQSGEVAMLGIHWICESPGEFPANNARFVDVWADN